MNEATISSQEPREQRAGRLRQLGHLLNSMGMLMLAGLALYIAVNLDWVTQALTERHLALAVIAVVFVALGTALVLAADSGRGSR